MLSSCRRVSARETKSENPTAYLLERGYLKGLLLKDRLLRLSASTPGMSARARARAPTHAFIYKRVYRMSLYRRCDIQRVITLINQNNEMGKEVEEYLAFAILSLIILLSPFKLSWKSSCQCFTNLWIFSCLFMVSFTLRVSSNQQISRIFLFLRLL